MMCAQHASIENAVVESHGGLCMSDVTIRSNRRKPSVQRISGQSERAIPRRLSAHLPELWASAKVKVWERTPIPVFAHDRSIYTVIRSTPSRVNMVKAS